MMGINKEIKYVYSWKMQKVKMSIPSKFIERSNAFPIKIRKNISILLIEIDHFFKNVI